MGQGKQQRVAVGTQDGQALDVEADMGSLIAQNLVAKSPQQRRAGGVAERGVVHLRAFCVDVWYEAK